MAHANTHAPIPNPGTFQFSGSSKAIFLALAALGAVVFAFGLVTSPDRAWASFVHNNFYFMCLGLGGAFFAAIQWLTGAMWSAPVRRLSEAFTGYLPFAFLMVIVLYFGIHHVY